MTRVSGSLEPCPPFLLKNGKHELVRPLAFDKLGMDEMCSLTNADPRTSAALSPWWPCLQNWSLSQASREPFSSFDLADLKNVDRFGQMPGDRGVAARGAPALP